MSAPSSKLKALPLAPVPQWNSRAPLPGGLQDFVMDDFAWALRAGGLRTGFFGLFDLLAIESRHRIQPTAQGDGTPTGSTAQ